MRSLRRCGNHHVDGTTWTAPCCSFRHQSRPNQRDALVEGQDAAGEQGRRRQLNVDPGIIFAIGTLASWAGWAALLRGIYLCLRAVLGEKSSDRPSLWRAAGICAGIAAVGFLLAGTILPGTKEGWRLPLVWLGCYGAAVTNGGQVSVAPVRYMGLSFLAAAGGAAITPREFGLGWLAFGFGWLHLVFGAYIAWRHNG